MRSSPQSPYLNIAHALQTFGPQGCMAKDSKRRHEAQQCAEGGSCPNPDAEPAEGEGGCIPAYRGGFIYMYYIDASAWFGAGAMCIGRNSHFDEEKVLMDIGIASEIDTKAAAKYGNGPCVQIPALQPAWNLTKALLKKLKKNVRAELKRIP